MFYLFREPISDRLTLVAIFLDKKRTLHKNSFSQSYEIISCLVMHNAQCTHMLV
jgi:hypothetical protein